MLGIADSITFKGETVAELAAVMTTPGRPALLLTSLMLSNPDIPHNAGMLRPINIVNSGGSFFNARFPAATTFGNSTTGPTSGWR